MAKPIEKYERKDFIIRDKKKSHSKVKQMRLKAELVRHGGGKTQ